MPPSCAAAISSLPMLSLATTVAPQIGNIIAKDAGALAKWQGLIDAANAV